MAKIRIWKGPSWPICLKTVSTSKTFLPSLELSDNPWGSWGIFLFFFPTTPRPDPPSKSVIKVSKFWLISNNFIGSNSFVTRLGVEAQSNEPIKLAFILTSKCQNMTLKFLMPFLGKFKLQNLLIFISILKELFKGSWKLEHFFQYLKYELRYDILQLEKFVHCTTSNTEYPLLK